MIIGVAEIKMQAAWVRSLKEKRMVVKSLTNKARAKFNISIAEIDAMDIQQTIILGISCVSNNKSHANSVLDNVLNFIEANTQAVIESVQLEFI